MRKCEEVEGKRMEQKSEMRQDCERLPSILKVVLIILGKDNALTFTGRAAVALYLYVQGLKSNCF
jgi:hypothetical protein